MAVQVRVDAEPRKKLGSAECRRIRNSGLIPGNVYGHDEAPAAVVVKQDAINAAIAAGQRVLDLSFGGKEGKVMLREVQWDAFGRQIQHVDLMRIDPDQKLVLDVPLDLRGQAAGTLAGGHLEQPLRTVSIECKVLEIPDAIRVRINHLEIGQSIYVRDLEVPPGVKVLTHSDLLVVHVVAAAAMPELEAGAGVAEPELIKKPEKEKGEE